MTMPVLEAIPPITRLSSRVFRILGLNPSMMTLQGSNTYLVGTGAERVLIDSGEGMKGYGDLLRETLARAGAELGAPVTISQLLLTHWHPDHVGGVDAVRALNPQVRVMKQPSQFNPVPVDAQSELPPAVLAVEGATLRLLALPGHTDDMVCAFLEEEQALFTSDNILGVGTSTFSCYHDYMRTLDRMVALGPALLYPAHGPVVADGVQRVREIIAHRQQREDQILAALARADRALCITDLVRQIYTSTPQHLWGAAGLNVFHHLKKLIHEAKVSVVACPDAKTDLLSDASDYAMLGEGVKTDPHLLQRMLSEFLVKKA
ncbi:metallo-beta-lactamase family-like protein [Strigomonas culicis]|uniref:Metallo-beta-lactamase family-like protein n=1 Tax=Strigomonas culicis TaxID=28005 RepID=S9W1T7_9TRYP|nr:metallo-beta-lactamase family-like protein [Strigomonas culicis]|eukprot:EPY33466.1 metallo-beta-lactamase family-like protein [Strigomonas culicis]